MGEVGMAEMPKNAVIGIVQKIRHVLQKWRGPNIESAYKKRDIRCQKGGGDIKDGLKYNSNASKPGNVFEEGFADM